MGSRIRTALLRRVFPESSDHLEAHIARLAVLYEDLRIEVHGLRADGLSDLDMLGTNYRREYFVRRSLATIREFAEALRLLDELQRFHAVHERFNAENQRLWGKSVRFFGRFEQYFRNVRNDIGGHFGLPAAIFAVRNLLPHASGTIEILEYGPNEHGPLLHFAGEIVATGTYRQLSGLTLREYERLVRRITAAYRRAQWATDAIIVHYLWDRFGR